MESPTVRERVLEGGLISIGRYGLARTTVDDVAQASGVSRATIYRHFPGGREQLVADTVAWETSRFFQRLGEAVAGAPDLCVLLEDALTFARDALAEHVVFQRVVQTEPEPSHGRPHSLLLTLPPLGILILQREQSGSGW